MEIKEVGLCESVAKELIVLSTAWEAENICYGYGKNTYEDLKGNRVFIAEKDCEIIGYLFGKLKKSKNKGAVISDGTVYFEVEELYVKPKWRSQGVGSALFRYVEARVRPEAEYLMLGTATKDFKSILHFYIDEMGMDFWSAALFKKL